MRLRVRSAGAALLAGGTAVVVVALLATGVAAAGQFAGQRFAPVLVPADTGALDIASVAVEPADGSDVTFVVTFRDGFASPSDGYRVSVSVGDPTGKRTRWTAAVFGGRVSGTVETGDGTVWAPVGPTVAELDAAAGRATIVAQTEGTPPGSALWAEAELPTPVGPFGSVTTFFAFDALAPGGQSAAPTSSWGWIRDPAGIRVDGAVRVPGAPPTVTTVNSALVISAPDAAPSLLLGQPVTATADLVRVLDARSGSPAGAGYLLVNRVTGEVQLFTLADGTPVEVPDGGAAAVPSSAPGAVPPAEPPSTRPVSVDLAALTGALGLPDDPTALAVTVDRAFTLGDGTVVTASGVANTLASLEPASSGAGSTPVTEDVVVPVEGSDEGIPVVVVLAVAGVALVAVVVALVLLARSRRRQRHSSLIAEGWLDRELTLRVPPTGRSPEPAPAAAPVEVEAAAPAVLDLDAVEAGGNGNGNGNGRHERVESGAPAAEGPATEGTAAEGPAAEGPSPDVARATQEQALADLEAQFADLVARVDRLGSHDGGGA